MSQQTMTVDEMIARITEKPVTGSRLYDHGRFRVEAVRVEQRTRPMRSHERILYKIFNGRAWKVVPREQFAIELSKENAK